jgi:DNA-binding HxlR family transcriptional regulator
MRKANSTNTINKNRIDGDCGMAYTLSLIGGRWKPGILWRLVKGRLRYNELRKLLPDVSERMLVLQLRELEKDGLIRRIVYAEVPPRVEYELTEDGISMKQVLKNLSDWGIVHQTRQQKTSAKAAGVK